MAAEWSGSIMGLEAYLFQIELNDPIDDKEIINFIRQSGMTFLSDKTEKFDDFISCYFEKRTKNGLTECLCTSENGKMQNFNMRFSIISPPAVIEQTFKIFDELNKLKKIRILDTEIRNQIYMELKKRNIIDSDFKGIKGTKLENEILERSYIPIDVSIFIKNEYDIIKRKIVLNNKKGKVIESDNKTIYEIEKSGTVEDYFGWIKDYL